MEESALPVAQLLLTVKSVDLREKDIPEGP